MRLSCFAWVVPFFAMSGCQVTAVEKPTENVSSVELASEKMQEFVVYKTTQSQVLAALGQPSDKVHEQGIETWYYSYQYNSPGPILRQENINISASYGFDQRGVLLRYYKENTAENSAGVMVEDAMF